MKKNILATTLLSVLAINTMSMTIYAEEMSDSATSTAKITFEGNDTHSNKPVNPDNPDDLIDKPDEVDPDDPNNHGTGDQGPLSIFLLLLFTLIYILYKKISKVNIF